HRRVVQERVRVHRLDLLRGAGDRALHAPDLRPHERLIGADTGLQRCGEGVAKHSSCRAFGPCLGRRIWLLFALPPRLRHIPCAAASATLPYVVVRAEGLCVTTLLAALHSEAGTLQALAAACPSIMRAVAPPLRTYSFASRMPRLPPVEKLPHTRLRATDWPGVGYSVVTFVQSASSSSATICARPVSVPCPISERATRTTTVSSG